MFASHIAKPFRLPATTNHIPQQGDMFIQIITLLGDTCRSSWFKLGCSHKYRLGYTSASVIVGFKQADLDRMPALPFLWSILPTALTLFAHDAGLCVGVETMHE
jgi:hypothetical protein